MNPSKIWVTITVIIALLNFFTSTFADDSNTDPTIWYWRTGTPSYIATEVNRGYRIVDLEVYTTSPFRLSALLVRNTGTYAQTWWWYYNIDAATLRSKLSLHKARIADIEAYMIGPKLYFSIVLTPNTGTYAKAWWYYYGVTPLYIASRLSANGARLVDIDSYKDGPVTRYAAVMIQNSGADTRTWWWYTGVTTGFIRARLLSYSARLTDIEYVGGNRFAVIMERSSARWYWYYGISSSTTLLNYAAQNGARLFHITPYLNTAGNRRWAGLMIANLNVVAESTFNYIAPKRKSGSFGFYMRRINGPVYASLLPTRVFEPAGSIKTLHYVHALRRVQLGTERLRNNIRVYDGYAGSCPLWTGSSSVTRLDALLKRMMRTSNNADAHGLELRYTQPSIEMTARQLGMTNTRIRHRIGCATTNGAIIGQTSFPNWLTLVGITNLYSRAATGYLVGKPRRKFFGLMASYGTILTVVDQEAAKLPTLSVKRKVDFRKRVFARQKGGSYNIGALKYKSIGAFVRLPVRSCAGVITNREYALGAFIDKSTVLIPLHVIGTAGAEMMRDEIRNALKTFIPCYSLAI